MKAKSRGSGSGCFIRFLVLVVVGFMLIGPLLRCAQRLPQMAANTAADAASGVASAAGNSLSKAARHVLDRIESLLGVLSPAEKFALACEHLPVEGVDKVCPYFEAMMRGATEGQATDTACYLTNVANAPNGADTLKDIQKSCPQTPNNAAAFQACVENYVNTYVASGDVASCARQGFVQKVHTLIEPLACIPGLPKSWCTTQSAPAASSADSSQPTRTDQSYLNCLQTYYQLLPNYNQALQCGTTVSAQTASCARSQLLNWTYQGQHFGVAQVQHCDGLPVQ